MNIYDELLAGIGVALLVTIASLWTIPLVGYIASFVTLFLMGVAMFVFTPTEGAYPPQTH